MQSLAAVLPTFALGLLLSALPHPAAAAGTALPMDFDTYASTLVAITRPAGILGALGLAGRDHAFWAPRWTGTMTFNPANPRALSLEIAAPVSSIEADTAEARRRASLPGDESSESERETLKRRLTGPEGLDAARFPDIRFRSLSVETPTPTDRARLQIRGSLSLHGVSREITVPIRVSTAEGGAVRLTGETRLKPEEYGVSGAKGDVNVRIDLRTKVDTSVALR